MVDCPVESLRDELHKLLSSPAKKSDGGGLLETSVANLLSRAASGGRSAAISSANVDGRAWPHASRSQQEPIFAAGLAFRRAACCCCAARAPGAACARRLPPPASPNRRHCVLGTCQCPPDTALRLPIPHSGMRAFSDWALAQKYLAALASSSELVTYHAWASLICTGAEPIGFVLAIWTSPVTAQGRHGIRRVPRPRTPTPSLPCPDPC